VHAQGWYRDPSTNNPGKNNTSNALRFEMCPGAGLPSNPLACATPQGMVAIQPGTFQMGSSAAGGAPYYGNSSTQPVHQVTISYTFWMGEKEVTQAQYAALMGLNPSYFGGNPNFPVERVSWCEARDYCTALTTQQASLGNVPAGYQYRLPTEAEWEYACRAGTTTEFNTGAALFCNDAKFSYSFHSNSSCNSSSPAPVGSYASNAWGLYDMHGNVWEWCLDSYSSYTAGAATNPFVRTGPFPYRIIRGGSWADDSSFCRSANRYGLLPGDTDSICGFRVVLAPVLTVTIAPVITTCAANQTVAANSNCQGVVPDFTAGVVASDPCGGSVTLSQVPAAGTLTTFGLSSTVVTITATNLAGNTSTCVATLTVTLSGACQTPAGFVLIQPGTFQMGESGVEGPVHAVTISHGFWMGEKEVTQAQYEALMGLNPSYFGGNPNFPVEQVSWFNARAYCAELTTQQAAQGNVPAGYQYRLPTEAEWEYACRATTTTSWNVGNTLNCTDANLEACVGSTRTVGSYNPNFWGLYDMHGNVFEWCLDSYAEYSSNAVTAPFVTGGPYRVFRGGSWFDNSYYCRSAIRVSSVPGDANLLIGFRVVLAPVLLVP